MKQQFNFDSQYAYRIKENLYYCSVPDEATLDPEYIHTFGVHSTGFKEADEQLSNRKCTVMINIPSILNYYLSGIDVIILNDDDIVEIHNLITGYLNEWKIHLENDINIRVTEYGEFLRGLEELNMAIYGMLTHEEYEETQPKTPDFFVRALDITNKEPNVKEPLPNYKDQYGSMISVIRDREKFENR